MFCLHVCLCIMCVWCQSHKRALGALKLELEIWTATWVLRTKPGSSQSSRCSWLGHPPPSSLQTPHYKSWLWWPMPLTPARRRQGRASVSWRPAWPTKQFWIARDIIQRNLVSNKAKQNKSSLCFKSEINFSHFLNRPHIPLKIKMQWFLYKRMNRTLYADTQVDNGSI